MFVTDWHTSLPIQAAMADFVEQGLFGRHLKRVRRVSRHAIAAATPDSPGVVVGYGMIDLCRIDEGLARLHQCLGAD